MEVHHHTHHPKSWKEYIQEFLMLFFAVFLGFMSEYYLEYRAERHKEHDYLVSMQKDLKADLEEMKLKDSNMEKIVNSGNKIVQLVYKPVLVETDIDSIYIHSFIIISRFYNIDFSSGTIDQLRNAGGFRLIQNEEIVREISDYEKGKGTMKIQLESIMERAANVHIIQNKLLHSTVFSTNKKIGEFGFDVARLKELKKQTGSAFITAEKTTLYEYANYASVMKGYMAYYEVLSKIQQEKAKALIKLIEAEIAHH